MTKTRVLTLAALLAAALAADAWGAQRLVLKDGRRIEGDVVETKTGYQVTQSSGLVVEFPKGEVLRVETVVTPADEFKARLAKAGDNPEKLYDAGVWAYRNKLLSEARATLKRVLALKADHENAKLQLKLVEAAIAAAAGGPVRPPDNGSGTTKPPVDLGKLLTKDDVFRIRFLEVKPTERAISIQFKNDVINRLVKDRVGPQFQKQNGEREFRRWPPIRKLTYVYDEADDRWSGRYRDDIEVGSDPMVMKRFRAQIWPVVVSGCASIHCHGGVKGGGKLKLFAAPLSDDRVVYTNYYILHEWKRDARRIINLDAPANSLLLEYGLPAKVAKPGFVHPKKLADPPFTSRRHADYVKVKKWIESLRNPMLPPGYRIQYKIPLLSDGKKPVDPKAIPEPPAPEPVPGPKD